jgi:hypothetical protein
MSETIAQSEWVRVRPNGERVTMTVEIGQPYEAPTGEWRTPVALHGLEGQLGDIRGEDSLQSLSLALDLVRSRLESVIAQGDLLSLPDEEGLDDEERGLLSIAQSLAVLDAYFPRR